MLQLKDANWLDHENIDLKVKTHDKKMSWTLKMFGITTNDQVSSIFNNIEYQDKINSLQTQRDWSRQHQHVQYYSIENDNSIQFKKRKVLKLLQWERRRLLYVSHKMEEDRALYRVIDQIELCMPCIIHAVIRIFCTCLLKHLFACVKEKNSEETFEKLTNYIGNVFQGMKDPTEDKESMCNIKVEKNKELKLSRARCVKLFDHIDNIIKIVFEIVLKHEIPEEGDAHEWSILFEKYIETINLLECRDNFTDEMIDHFDNVQYSFCTQFLKLLGGSATTRYIHDMISRHTVQLLQMYRNFWFYSQCAMEAKIGSLRGCLFNQMNLGSGKNLLHDMNV